MTTRNRVVQLFNIMFYFWESFLFAQLMDPFSDFYIEILAPFHKVFKRLLATEKIVKILKNRYS